MGAKKLLLCPFDEALTGGEGSGRLSEFKNHSGYDRSFSALTSLSKFCWGRMSFLGISFYVLSLLFGPCRLSEFTLSGPL